MKYSLIFITIFIESSKSNIFKCGRPYDEEKSIEYYCDNYSETVPKLCSSSYSVTNLADKSKVTKLKIGGCEHDEIIWLVEILPNLHSLDISYSMIDSLEFLNLEHKHLVNLNVSHNKLEKITRNFSLQMPKLSEIDFSFNKISSIDSISFNGLHNLNYLDLSYNLISKFKTSFRIDVTFKTLRLNYNPISSYDCKLLSLVKSGVSVHFSWKYIEKLLTECMDYKIRIVSNSPNEGLLHSTDGTIELHCNEQSLQQFQHFVVTRSNFENAGEIVNCLTEALQDLDLSGHIAEKLNHNTFDRFINLSTFKMRNTQIMELDLSILKSMKKLSTFRIIDNGLNIVTNVSYLKELENIKSVTIEEKRLNNTLEIINNLNPTLKYLYLNGCVEPINITSITKLKNLTIIDLDDVRLLIDDFNQFEQFQKLEIFGISNSNFKNVNFSMLSVKLRRLKVFVATCQILSNQR